MNRSRFVPRSFPRLQPDDRTHRRRRVPRITPPRRPSQLHRLSEHLHPPQAAKKPAHAPPQRVSTPRCRGAHQPDQQPEHHIVIAVRDNPVRTDQHALIGKLRTQLPQLPHKSRPAPINAQHLLPRAQPLKPLSSPVTQPRTRNNHHRTTVTPQAPGSPVTQHIPHPQVASFSPIPPRSTQKDPRAPLHNAIMSRITASLSEFLYEIGPCRTRHRSRGKASHR